MCKGMDDLILQSKNEGIIIGKNEGIIISENKIIMNLYNKKYDIKEIADIVNKPIDYVNNIIEEYNKTLKA